MFYRKSVFILSGISARSFHRSSPLNNKPFKKKWMFSTRIGSHSNELALQYFDFAYPLIFHRHWPSIRLALLSVPKPVALLNPFSLVNTDVKDKLIRQGAVDLLRFNNEELRNRHSEVQKRIGQSDRDYAEKKLLEQQERRRLLGTDISMPVADDDDDNDDEEQHAALLDENDDEEVEEEMKKFNQPEPVQRLEDMLQTALEQQAKSVVKGDTIRIVDEHPSQDYRAIPPSWNVYTFPRGDVTRFEPAKTDSLGRLDYYCMDGACILPVLALDIKPFQSVLDLCAAPGGKALNIFHMCPYIQLTCNDKDMSRWRRLVDVFNQTIPKDMLAKHIQFVHGDGDLFGQQKPDSFDRVLVDVPCSSDRHSLITSFNIFSKRRIQERVELPAYQQKLLSSGIRACKPGGTIVYSTCTLAPIQNEGVVEKTIENLSRRSPSIKCEIVSTRSIEEHFAYFFEFHQKVPYGSLVLPHISNNFGPLYFCKIRRIS